jgi:hypothetical protein
MMHRSWIVALAIAGVACGGSAVAPIENRAAGGPADPAEAPPPTVELLRGFAMGSRLLADHVDAVRGVAFVAYFTDPSDEDPRAGRDGIVRISDRLCGDALTVRLDRLREDLNFRVVNESMLYCSGQRCTSSALGEYHTNASYYFTSDSGKLELDAVIEVEGGPVTEEFAQQGASWAEAERTRLERKGCSAP